MNAGLLSTLTIAAVVVRWATLLIGKAPLLPLTLFSLWLVWRRRPAAAEAPLPEASRPDGRAP